MEFVTYMFIGLRSFSQQGLFLKAGTEEQVNMVRSSNEDGSASKKEKVDISKKNVQLG